MCDWISIYFTAIPVLLHTWIKKHSLLRCKHFSCPRVVGVYTVETTTSYYYVYRSQ